MPARFLPLADVAEILSISSAQAYALVRSGDLPAIKVGGRGQWRVETTELEEYIRRMYSQTRALVDRGGLDAADGPSADVPGGGSSATA
ncbi:helix-turn-helix domain-containing protein [Pseudokineococcus basanitobsidens]|uniref:Helix-turn-helix domain-containing protein n=1 Tax=Pseudokineococcus basanitobsidens TaxID=1926649 RepID=A0ABU8RM33_9ACTN